MSFFCHQPLMPLRADDAAMMLYAAITPFIEDSHIFALRFHDYLPTAFTAVFAIEIRRFDKERQSYFLLMLPLRLLIYYADAAAIGQGEASRYCRFDYASQRIYHCFEIDARESPFEFMPIMPSRCFRRQLRCRLYCFHMLIDYGTSIG